MTSSTGVESAAIGNNQAWKAMVTIYYVEDDFRKVGGIDCIRNWFVGDYLVSQLTTTRCKS